MNIINRSIVAAATLLALAPAGAAVAQEGEQRPEVLKKLVDCRAVADDGARLACYDAQVLALDTAEKDRQVIVVDREQVREARRGLFGLTLPNLAIFDGPDEDKESFAEIETTIKSARENARGRWTFVLEDGARWVQLDSRELPVHPRAGHPIRIRQAAMGSYLANVNNQIAIRVRREN